MSNDYITELEKVNKSIEYMDFKGKKYAQVNQRILAFWQLFPQGCITTTVLEDDGSRCEIKCEVFRDSTDETPAATGHAYETKGGIVNETSYVENCETSAIGRALGVLGIGSTEALASAEEVEHAISQQEKNDPKENTTNKIARLKKQAIKNGIKEEGINSWYEAHYGKKSLNKLSEMELFGVEKYLEEIVADSADGHLKG